MSLGMRGQWREALCTGRYMFLCEKDVTEFLPAVDSYLTGLALLTGVYTQTQIHPLTSVPNTGQLTVEMQLFPGLWFSHAGQLVSVDLVVQPSPVASLARVQILRPYCDPNHHLVPPGCRSLFNPFSCCSVVPLCNTTGGCSVGQYWCHLTETCLLTTSPCSPYDLTAGGHGYILPPRYPSLPPFYHLAADLPLKISPSPELQTLNLLLPDRAVMVYPDDIVAIQHTRDSGTFLHCLESQASLNSPWRQSYMSLRGAEWGGWWEGGLTSLPKGGKWVDGVVCDLRMLYVDNLHRGTEHDGERETTMDPDIWAVTSPTPSLTSEFGLDVIHPVPDEMNRIHVQINMPTLIVVKVLSGQKVSSSWSNPVHQTGVPFFPYFPQEVAQSCPGCTLASQDHWFSSVTLMMPSVGIKKLNISVTNGVHSQSMTVTVCSYEAVTGLSVEPHGCLRMLIETPQTYTGKVESGSSVKFTWIIDNLENSAHEGESYSVVFKKPAVYRLKVTASNPVSSVSQEILLTADEMAPFTEPEFLSAKRIIAMDAAHLYTIRLKVDVSLPVIFTWDLGDGSSKVIHTQYAPCQTMEGLMERGRRQVYVQDSVNHTYSITGDYTFNIHVSNQYDSTDASVKISVRPLLKRLRISSSHPVALIKQTLLLEAFTEPSTFAVVYTWHFGDGSQPLQDINQKVSHDFTSAGVYNVTVSVNNTLSVLATWLMVEVMEEISGLTVRCSGPSELSSATDFKAVVATGTSLKWHFDFGDGYLQENMTDGSVSHIYKSPGKYSVNVTVSNSVSQAHQSLSVEVYRLSVSTVLPTECVMSEKDIQFTALVNGNSSFLTFHWLFGDGSPLNIVQGQSTVIHKYQNQGIFPMNLTVFSSVTSVSFIANVCVDAEITSVAVQTSQEVVAVGEEVCFTAIVHPEPMTAYQLKWIGSSSSLTTRSEGTENCFVFKDEGFEEVSVMASNKVSTQTAKARVKLQFPVSKLSVTHDSEHDTVTVNTLVTFWVASCSGSNVSVLWDFGDGSPAEQKTNVSHVFTSTGQFTVTSTASNAISRETVTLTVNVLLPVSDLSLHTNQPFAVAGEETVFTAISSAISTTNYYWTVDGVTTTKQGFYQFKFVFPKPGVYQVKVMAQNLVSAKEAVTFIEVFERIGGVQIECQSLINMKYVPTQEELLFIASVTKGSNVTYQWLATQSGINQQTRGDRELFRMIAETPGEISVNLSASNVLGDATSAVSVVAMEHVTGAHFSTESNVVALGKLVNISVSVERGSNLLYLWYLNSSDLSPTQTHVPFLLHTFSRLGHCLVKVSVRNELSQSNITKEFEVEEGVYEADFEIEGKTLPFYISTGAAVSLHGHVQKGSALHWDWKVRVATTLLFSADKQTLRYTFPRAGVYQVSLNVSNGINWQVVSHSVTAQDPIKGLLLNMSKPSICPEEQVTFIPTISGGSNVSFAITFPKNDGIHSQEIPEGGLTTSSILSGTHLVTVKAWNQVSSAESSSTFLVNENIQGLKLVNCCSAVLEPLKGTQFKAEVKDRNPIIYTWTFQMVGFDPTHLMGQDVIFAPPANGSLSVSVLATNGVCSKTVNETATVHCPVKRADLFCHLERIFLGHVAVFSAIVNGGSDLKFLWDFGDSTETLVTDFSTVNHTYYISGIYSVMVKVLNGVSHVSTQLIIKVEELQCSSPQASIVQSQSTIFRSRPNVFEASVDVNCSAYRTLYLWEIFKQSTCTNTSSKISGNKVTLRGQIGATSPIFLLPQHALNVGQYCLVFTASLQGTPLAVQQATTFTVMHSRLVAVIKGGSQRTWSSLSDLILDGSESKDPDTEPGVEDALQYDWTFITVNSTDSNFMEQSNGTNSSRITIVSTWLKPNTVYIFSLTVHKAGRRAASVNQTVTVCDTPVLPVTVECVSCFTLSSHHHTSYTDPVILSGLCGECDNKTQYKWSAEDQTGIRFDLNEVTTSTGRHSPDLEVRSGVLWPGRSYIFTLSVSQPNSGQSGSASVTLLPNDPPHGGICDVSPQSDIHLLETAVTFNCSGWQSEGKASQLIYTLQVTPCQPQNCPTLTLYRGTRSTFSCLVPMGNSGKETGSTAITLILLVEDHLGAKVIAIKRMLTVKSPVKDKAATRWLKSKSETELWALVQHGNPQEIIPYSIALISQLNQMESGRGAGDLMDRREIRKNVTLALASLPVSSLLDANQLSSALSQSTAAPGELIGGSCQEKVLEAVGKMINLIDRQMSPGHSLSAPEIGRNILSIIGHTLAAVSESVPAPSSQPDYMSPLESASTITLSALGQAGVLMRSLVHSHIPGRPPLSFSTSYINTVGFHGDPTNLLCAHQSNKNQTSSYHASPADESASSHPCRFYIPSSLTAHLKSQNSEVVQVMFGTDSKLGFNPLLTEADPPISTDLVAMELTTPQGKPIPVQDLDHEQAIRVTLPNRQLVEPDEVDRDGRPHEAGNRTCLTVTLPREERLNLTVKAVDGLDENAGLFISFNFSLGPGATPVSVTHVKIEVSSTAPGTNASQHSLERVWNFTLSAPSTWAEESIFLSPLSLCQYYSLKERRWSSEGLQPLEGSTLHAAHCLTKHLTMFGASLFVHPGAVVLLPPSGGPVRNMLVAIVVSVLLLIHLLLWLIAHKLDHLDSVRLSQVPLCGQPGLYHYRVLVKTGWKQGAGTTAHVGISLYGVNKSGSRHLKRDGAFQRGSLDQFHVETDDSLGEIWKIRICHDNTGLDPSWYVEHVVVWDPQTDHMFFFVLEDWLSVENQKNSTVEKEVLASCPEELSQFRRVFTSQLMFGMVERHLWLSLWLRPAHSCFNRAQRVTCSALVLHLYLALGALWYGAVGTKGHSGPVSAHLLLSAETVAVGMTVAALVFPLQCFLCFLFRKAPSQMVVDTSLPPSPVCHSVEMDVHLGQSDLSGPSFLSLPDSSSPVGDTPLSLHESKAFDSSILEFWAASGLAPQTDGARQEEGIRTWPSCDSLLNLPLDLCRSDQSPEPSLAETLPSLGPNRQLKRKKALMQLHITSPSSTDPKVSTTRDNMVQTHTHNLTTLLTLSEEDLLMSIVAAAENTSNSNSDSGRDSPRTTSSLSNTRSTSCSSWSERSEDKSLYGAEIHKPDPQSCPSLSGPGLYKCPSVLSVDSVASTFLPSPSPDSTRSSSTTRIGVARGRPGRLLPPWALRVICPLVVMLLGACLAVVGLYGSFLSRTVVLMWLISAFSAFLTSALLLEPLKVLGQAVIHSVLWRPVDPEVEGQLALVTTVVRVFGVHSGKVRPPCGYGLLQAKEEARKVRALRSLMKHCVCQLLFLLLVLLVNYQDSVEQSQGRLLHSAVRRHLHTTPQGGVPNLTSLTDWSDAEQWIVHTLVPQLHQNPMLSLAGLPRLQYSQTFGPSSSVLLGNNTETTQNVLTDLHMATWNKRQSRTLSIDLTHYHRESGLLVCVSVRLERAWTQRVSSFVRIHPFLAPSSSSGSDLQVALMVLLLLSALLILSGELQSMTSECAQYLCQGRHWFQLLLVLLALAAAILQLCSLSKATSCISKLRSQPESFIDFQSAALLAQRGSQCAAILLTLLVLKVLGTLRFVRRWVVFSRVLQRAWWQLLALTALLLLLLLLCAHLGNTLFSRSVEGFLSVRETGVSTLSLLHSRKVLQRLCRVHPVLGPLYGLLVMGGGVWLLARLCGVVLIHAYRAEQAELYRPNIEPQDYEMVEFFIKRLKLWMGLSKAKEFRHRVKFEGMDFPPSRSSQESSLSTVVSGLTSPSSSLSSPRPLWSALSLRSEDSSGYEPGFDVQPYLDRLHPCVSALLSRFEQVNQITEDVQELEMKLEEFQARRRKRCIREEAKSGETFGDIAKPKDGKGIETGEVRYRKPSLFKPTPQVFLQTPAPHYPTATAAIFPRTRTCSESESTAHKLRTSSDNPMFEAATLASGIGALSPSGSPGSDRFPRRRAWHCGSSHSADAAQRILLSRGGAAPVGAGGDNVLVANTSPQSEEGMRRAVRDGVPVKRKAWTEQD
ncbi:uncharacterized protein V6R79_002157 [Siganus canaliculatus]